VFQQLKREPGPSTMVYKHEPRRVRRALDTRRSTLVAVACLRVCSRIALMGERVTEGIIKREIIRRLSPARERERERERELTGKREIARVAKQENRLAVRLTLLFSAQAKRVAS